jgi:hypothetical protein
VVACRGGPGVDIYGKVKNVLFIDTSTFIERYHIEPAFRKANEKDRFLSLLSAFCRPDIIGPAAGIIGIGADIPVQPDGG